MVVLLLMVGLCSVSVEESLAQDVDTQERVESLIERLKYGGAQERRDAARALGEIGPEAAPAVEALIDALKYEDVRVRRTAAWALGQIGPEAAPAVETLIETLKDENAFIRCNATRA